MTGGGYFTGSQILKEVSFSRTYARTFDSTDKVERAAIGGLNYGGCPALGLRGIYALVLHCRWRGRRSGPLCGIRLLRPLGGRSRQLLWRARVSWFPLGGLHERPSLRRIGADSESLYRGLYRRFGQHGKSVEGLALSLFVGFHQGGLLRQNPICYGTALTARAGKRRMVRRHPR